MKTKQQEVYAIPFINEPSISHIRKDITKNPRQFVVDMMTGSKYQRGVMDMMSYGVYLEMGYKYNLRSFLRRFVYKQYGSWHEVWALDKSNVRKLVGGRIDKIVEVVD